MRIAYLGLIAVLACFASIEAGGAEYVSDGHVYDMECTGDGYRFTSKYPVARTVGSGADSHIVTKPEKLYLGRDCDAYHEIFGNGTWCWANGGFVAEFTDMKFGFGRQELWCEPERDYEQNCRC